MVVVEDNRSRTGAPVSESWFGRIVACEAVVVVLALTT